MQTCSIPTDRSMRSTLTYGTDDFPFACYQDKIEDCSSRCVEWHWHWHREFEFSMVVAGRVNCKIGHKVLSLDAGDALFLNSRTIHRFEAPDHGTLKNLIFLPEFLAPLSSVVFRNYVQPVLSSDCESIPLVRGRQSHGEALRLIRRICESVDAGGPAWELETQRLVLGLWQELYALFRNGRWESRAREDLAAQERLRGMLSYIHENYGDPIALKDISAAANISPSEALRCFHAGIQTTPVRYLNRYRLRRAEELLLSTSDTITAIAASVGFGGSGYFCRVFKQQYGCTPNEFRKRR